MDKTPEISKNTFTFGKNKQNNDESSTALEDDDEEFKFEETQCVQYEGYVYKFSQTQKKMKKTYFKLIGKDLYYYKKKEEEKHRWMHNLSGVFIKRGDDLEFEGKKYYILQFFDLILHIVVLNLLFGLGHFLISLEI